MKTHEAQDHLPIDLSEALLLDGKTLALQPEKYSAAVPKKFSSEKELRDLVLLNHPLFFDEDTVLIDALKSPFPGLYLFDLRHPGIPSICALHISLHERNFLEIFASVTTLISNITVDDKPLRAFLHETVMGDKQLAKTFKEFSATMDTFSVFPYNNCKIVFIYFFPIILTFFLELEK